MPKEYLRSISRRPEKYMQNIYGIPKEYLRGAPKEYLGNTSGTLKGCMSKPKEYFRNT